MSDSHPGFYGGTKMHYSDLSEAQQETIGHLFTNGPIWDGYLVSKQARSELCDLGLVFRYNGWQALTPAGLALAVEAPVKGRRNQRWYIKQQNITSDGNPPASAYAAGYP